MFYIYNVKISSQGVQFILNSTKSLHRGFKGFKFKNDFILIFVQSTPSLYSGLIFV